MRRLSIKLGVVCSAAVLASIACANEKAAARDQAGANDAAANAVDAPPPAATAPASSAAPAVTPPTTGTSTALPSATSAAPASLTVTPAIQALVDSPDRTADDRALDAGRKPGEVLAFFNLKPGMRVAELGAGRGYTTELLARAVAPTGTVYAQNPPEFLATFLKTAWPERLARPIMSKVVRFDRPFGSPFPDEVKSLDAVISFALYHDTVWMDVDRKAMNEVIFKALKPGGAYFIVDSSARDGAGTSEVKTLHRIEESAVRAEVLAAGFRLDGESDFLRNPADARDWNSSPSAAGAKRGTSDRFALRFVKPQ